MKKLFAILLAAAMILSLVGCAKEEVPTVDAVEVPVAEEVAEVPVTDDVPEVPAEDVPEIMIPSADAVELPPAQPDPNNQFGMNLVENLQDNNDILLLLRSLLFSSDYKLYNSILELLNNIQVDK